VKFWQMIGRGTRLCENLFGPGEHKKKFRIFDHWGNFEFFEERFEEAEPSSSKSLMQRLFDARIELAEQTLANALPDEFQQTVDLIRKDVNALPEESIAVQEKWREKRVLSTPETLKAFTSATVAALKNDVGPLMQWVNIRSFGDAIEFDLLMTEMQTELIKESARFDNLKNSMIDRVSQLQVNLTPVAEKIDIVREIQTAKFWKDVTVNDLESARNQLRGIMQTAKHCLAGQQSTAMDSGE